MGRSLTLVIVNPKAWNYGPKSIIRTVEHILEPFKETWNDNDIARFLWWNVCDANNLTEWHDYYPEDEKNKGFTMDLGCLLKDVVLPPYTFNIVTSEGVWIDDYPDDWEETKYCIEDAKKSNGKLDVWLESEWNEKFKQLQQTHGDYGVVAIAAKF